MLLTQGGVMVLKKKAAKVEAVALDEEKLQTLIGKYYMWLLESGQKLGLYSSGLIQNITWTGRT